MRLRRRLPTATQNIMSAASLGPDRMEQLSRLRRALTPDPFTGFETALAALVVGPVVFVGVLLAVAPTSTITWSLLAIGSVAAALGAFALPFVSLAHACYDCWRLVRADDRLPTTRPGFAYAAWRWLETLLAALYVGSGLFGIWVLRQPRAGSGEVTPLPGWSTVFVLLPLLVAGLLAITILLRVAVTVGREFRP